MYDYLRNNSISILPPYESFILGNAFKDIYDPFKNYKPTKLIPNNEQAEMLLNVGQLCFIVHELNLYLDVNPDDKNILSMFNNYNKMANEAIKKYESKYGPLVLSNILEDSNSFSWEETSWPWEDK